MCSDTCSFTLETWRYLLCTLMSVLLVSLVSRRKFSCELCLSCGAEVIEHYPRVAKSSFGGMSRSVSGNMVNREGGLEMYVCRVQSYSYQTWRHSSSMCTHAAGCQISKDSRSPSRNSQGRGWMFELRFSPGPAWLLRTWGHKVGFESVTWLLVEPGLGCAEVYSACSGQVAPGKTFCRVDPVSWDRLTAYRERCHVRRGGWTQDSRQGHSTKYMVLRILGCVDRPGANGNFRMGWRSECRELKLDCVSKHGDEPVSRRREPPLTRHMTDESQPDHMARAMGVTCVYPSVCQKRSSARAFACSFPMDRQWTRPHVAGYYCQALDTYSSVHFVLLSHSLPCHAFEFLVHSKRTQIYVHFEGSQMTRKEPIYRRFVSNFRYSQQTYNYMALQQPHANSDHGIALLLGYTRLFGTIPHCRSLKRPNNQTVPHFIHRSTLEITVSGRLKPRSLNPVRMGWAFRTHLASNKTPKDNTRRSESQMGRALHKALAHKKKPVIIFAGAQLRTPLAMLTLNHLTARVRHLPLSVNNSGTR
ncbi:hypothetical protein VFPPC_15775 [Pochonia chlamydosporia 170]|uniref:Uncharacterized protein n=1 Tax=Pochonia chlamydosporia 170 TaxID=1380566 RepID=A0A179FSR3_METCM|nr:hypothetical protein VFPPC_15775 [Pochonia chlamydosporia 170]OAQ68059.1 hypothetical protein VFPPC_15775 [Pochonia chlamydosporia 170]